MVMKVAGSHGAAAYIRVSSEEQLDGHSLDAQRGTRLDDRRVVRR